LIDKEDKIDTNLAQRPTHMFAYPPVGRVLLTIVVDFTSQASLSGGPASSSSVAKDYPFFAR
jgi:hypothetical protein